MKSSGISPMEWRSTLGIAAIYSFRMLGLFMVLPVFSLFAHGLPHATPFLIGLALGVYGLTQGLLQIPFGLFSDKIGRKPVIALGLLLFGIGSIIAARAHGIHGIILGRALQGAGAIGSSLSALLADLTREEHRTKAMGVIGITIGLAFTVGMILGPILNIWIKVTGIFWLTAFFAGAGIIILWFAIPAPKHSIVHKDAETVPILLINLLKDAELLRLNYGIFALHAMLTANFIVIPILLAQGTDFLRQNPWDFYLPVIFGSFLLSLPMIILSEKKRQLKQYFTMSIGLLLTAQILLTVTRQVSYLAFLLFLFFAAFNFLEASLPSLISKRAPAGAKGPALGIYSTSQFLGIFIGGALGGLLYSRYGISYVFAGCALLLLVWFLAALSMSEPKYLSTKVLKFENFAALDITNLYNELIVIKGVKEIDIDAANGVAYLKIDKKELDEQNLAAYQQTI